MVSALDFQAGYRGFESRSGRDNFQTISTPGSYSTCPGLSIKWTGRRYKVTGRRLVTDSGTKCAWMIHESKAVHDNRRCLYVPRVPGSIKNPHNNNNTRLERLFVCHYRQWPILINCVKCYYLCLLRWLMRPILALNCLERYTFIWRRKILTVHFHLKKENC